MMAALWGPVGPSVQGLKAKPPRGAHFPLVPAHWSGGGVAKTNIGLLAAVDGQFDAGGSGADRSPGTAGRGACSPRRAD